MLYKNTHSPPIDIRTRLPCTVGIPSGRCASIHQCLLLLHCIHLRTKPPNTVFEDWKRKFLFGFCLFVLVWAFCALCEINSYAICHLHSSLVNVLPLFSFFLKSLFFIRFIQIFQFCFWIIFLPFDILCAGFCCFELSLSFDLDKQTVNTAGILRQCFMLLDV